MRKGLLLILSLALILTLVIPSAGFASLADYDEDLEGAIIKAKEIFHITDSYDKFNYNVNSYNNRTEFYLNWSDSSNKLGNISVTIDSTGIIRRYYSYTPYTGEYKPRLAKLSKNQGKSISDKFIKKVDPEYIGKIEYVVDNTPLNVNARYYNFTYTRKENGVLFPSNNIRVSVDNMTGKVNDFHINWDADLEFPSTDEIISLEEAQAAYKEKIGLQLVYKFKYVENEKIPYLVYTNLTNENSIDAKSGEIFKSNIYYGGMDEKMLMNDKVQDAGLTPAEKEAIDNIKGLMSKEDAEKLVREKLNVKEDFELNYINLYSHWRDAGIFSWNMAFQSVDTKDSGSVNVTVNAKTGEIMSFYRYSNFDENAEGQYDQDASQKLAQDFIKEFQPQKYDKVEHVTWNQNDVIPLEGETLPRQYSFYFARKANDAYVSNNGFNVTVDTVTGEIISYNFEWSEVELPASDDVISIDEANQVLFDNIGMELIYIVHYNQNNEIREPEGTQDNREIRLVYSINNDKPLNIDGNTGDILNNSGEVYKEVTIVEYTDIDESYAKSQIEVLAQYGIALPGDKLYPSKEINQREFLYLLAKANNYYINQPFSNDSKFNKVLYEILINQGIIKDGEKAPESQVNKEEAVKFIIRALKYDKIASIPGIYLINFKDSDKISTEIKGHIAIANGLNIISGYDGYFNPTNKLTKEQAATVIYNYLNSNS